MSLFGTGCRGVGDPEPLGAASPASRRLAAHPTAEPLFSEQVQRPRRDYRLVHLLLVASMVSIVSPTMAQKRKMAVDLIIRGATIVTMDNTRRVIENGAVAVKA